MSGPKRSDVQAELNIAQRTHRQCANQIATIENSIIKSIQHKTNTLLHESAEQEQILRNEIKNLTPEVCRIVPEAIQQINESMNNCSTILTDSHEALKQAEKNIGRTKELEIKAKRSFENAESEFEHAKKALNDAGGHYLRKEMNLAKQATHMYQRAAKELAEAVKLRKETERQASIASKKAQEVKISIKNSLIQVKNTQSEAQAQLKAEAIAKKIAEEKRRNATVSLEKARSSIQHCKNLPHQKFYPGKVDTLLKDLELAFHQIDVGQFDQASKNSELMSNSASQLAKDIQIKQQEYEKLKAEANSQIQILQIASNGLDKDFIKEWSDQPEATILADQAISQARGLVNNDQFKEAIILSQHNREKLSESLKSAAEAKSSHEQRMTIGEAIMETLEELEFEVSFEAGNKNSPMRIAGQTPDETGKGDFDIAIPLNGEVDFEVNTPEGDATCIAAVCELQRRLESRGVKWETTHWGHEDGSIISEQKKSKSRTKEKQKEKRK